MSNKIEVITPFGVLIAEASGDPDYPGIHICLNNGKEERQLVLVESTPSQLEEETRTLRVLVWANDSEDYSHELKIIEERFKEVDHV